MNDDEGSAREDAGTKRAFLAHMRHELRTPLNAIIGYSEMWLEEAQAPGMHDFVDGLGQIHTSGQRLLTLVNDMLDPVRIEASPLQIDLETCGVKIRQELRTPLDTVIGHSELLLERAVDRGDEAFIADLQKVQTAGNRLLVLVDDIVHLSTIEADETMASVKTASISAMARDVEADEQTTDERDARVTDAERGVLLLVDDNDINRDLLSRRLQRLGHTVAVAADGVAALQMMRSQTFDLVLLDIMMPKMNGYQVLAHMKADQALRDLPVIMMSALYETDSVVRCIQMGAADYLPKPFNPVLLRVRVGACLERKRLHDQEVRHLHAIKMLARELEVRDGFIRKTFGRYFSDDIVETILATPEGLNLGGEARKVTILMSDLRGFTASVERLPPEKVVALLNIYLGTMTDVITQFDGTIEQFSGDDILVIFGAPIRREDDAHRAVACAVAMQRAMAAVNEQTWREGLPEVAMGVGINTGEVVAGNVGSLKRSKYGVVGSHVNLTSRIGSHTVGGQILISEATLQDVGSLLRVDGQMTVAVKGVQDPITVYEVGGIGGAYNVFLPARMRS